MEVDVGGHRLQLGNLDKIFYPEVGVTKGEVVDYYARIADVMVPHLAGRGVTLKRFPDGVDGTSFFEKRCPGHRPDFVGTVVGPGDRRGGINYCCLDSTAALVWAANMAALEIHAPMALGRDLEAPTMCVFDLDPGPGTGMTECARAALEIRDLLTRFELTALAKTSGSKGLQLYVPLNTEHTHEHCSSFALAVAQVLEKQRPGDVTTTMRKAARPGKVFVDWSQNSRHKTTVAVYSLRARPEPTVSCPVTWDEVAAAADGGALSFLADVVLDRVTSHGDLFGNALALEQHLPRPSN
jgi:bifunctional non-homologous end joining protein LigD